MNADGPAVLLGLDADRVQRVAVAYAGYGLARWNEVGRGADGTRSENSISLAARAFARAGGYFAIVDAGSAALTFWAAATCFAQLRALRSLSFAVCARAALPKNAVTAPVAVPMPEDVAALFLHEAMGYARGEPHEAVGRRANDVTSVSMLAAEVAGTRARIGDFQALRQAMTDFGPAAGRGKVADYVVEPVVAIVGGAAELVHRARSDTFHWRRLLSAVSPAPLEGLAAGVVYFTAAADGIDPLLSRLRQAGHADEALAILEAARSLAKVNLKQYVPTDALQALAVRRGDAGSSV
ncbi:MAG: hypothetical protein WAN59_00590 [Candidatus Baltobacteraceae bacterium]